MGVPQASLLHTAVKVQPCIPGGDSMPQGSHSPPMPPILRVGPACLSSAGATSAATMGELRVLRRHAESAGTYPRSFRTPSKPRRSGCGSYIRSLHDHPHPLTVLGDAGR